jgi:hypothetical protein
MTASSVYLTVTLLDRSDGGLRVYSEDLPGLILSGHNKREVCDRIAPAIRALFEHKGDTVINVFSSQPLIDAVREPSPRDVGMHVQTAVRAQHETFVVVLESQVAAQYAHT